MLPFHETTQIPKLRSIIQISFLWFWNPYLGAAVAWTGAVPVLKETGKRLPATRLGWRPGTTRSCLPARGRGTATGSAALRLGSRRLMILEAAAAARTGGGASGGFFRGSSLQGGYLTCWSKMRWGYPDLNESLVYFPVLRIRDVYPGSRILIFTHPRSRIQKQQQKRGVKKKNLLSYLFL